MACRRRAASVARLKPPGTPTQGEREGRAVLQSEGTGTDGSYARAHDGADREGAQDLYPGLEGVTSGLPR